MPIVRPFNPSMGRPGLQGPSFRPAPGGTQNRPWGQPLGSFDKLKGKKKIKKSGTYKLKRGETVVGKKKADTHAFVAGKKA